VDVILAFRIAHPPHRSHRGPRLEIVTHWDGYDTTHDSWEPYASLKHVEAFHNFARYSSALARLFRRPTYPQSHSHTVRDSLPPFRKLRQRLPRFGGGLGMLGFIKT
jgi:hypothetical protein